MKKEIVLYDKNNQEVKCDILIEFEYDSNQYIVYTDNKINKNGGFNLYKAKLDDNKISDPTDVDVDEIFDKLILDYKNKIIGGEI